MSTEGAQAMGENKHKKDPRSGARFYFETATPAADGSPRWMATITRGGNRWRFFGKSKGEVEDKVAQKLTELANEGTDAVQLSAEQRRDAARARKLLAEGETLADALDELRDSRRLLGLVDADGKATGTGAVKGGVKSSVAELAEALAKLGGRATLASVVGYWTERNPDGNAVTFGEARVAFMREAVDGVHSHRVRVEQRLEALAEYLGRGSANKGDRRALVSIEAGEVDAMLEDHRRKCEAGELIVEWDGKDGKKSRILPPRPFSDTSKGKWLKTYKHFFSWSARKYELPIDISSKMEGPRKSKGAASKPVEFMAVADVEKLLRAAEEVEPEFVPVVAIAFFCGLRPTELVGKYEGEGKAIPGLDWGNTDRDGVVVVDGETCKTRQRRTVPMSKNLLAWLAAYPPEVREGPVAQNPTAWRRAREAIVEAAGVPWPQNAARKSFATYHFGKYADRARLEAALGHVQGSEVLESNYKSLVTKAEAERFWGIMPTAKTTKKSSRKAVRA